MNVVEAELGKKVSFVYTLGAGPIKPGAMVQVYNCPGKVKLTV